MNRSVSSCLTIALLGGLLAGCSTKFYDALVEHYGWNEERIVAHGWAMPRPTLVEPVYCYRTLADAECHEKPLEEPGERLVGQISPPVN